MKKQLLFLFSALFFFSFSFGQTNIEKNKEKTNKAKEIIAVNKSLTKKQVKSIRKKHAKNLANSPFKKSLQLSKKERKALAIPPNKYYEMEYELTMNPETGRPTPENLVQIRANLKREREEALASGRTPGDASDNSWVERGPNNVGGRVRAIMFDPNDPTFKRVFAGGVSGGLWVNNDITTNTAWTRVNIPENLAVSTLTVDPNNSNIFYVGTGESYVAGDVNGNGVWKSTDGGTTWTNIFGGITGATTFESSANVVVNSPAGVAGSYPCYPTTAFGTPITSPIIGDIVIATDGTAPIYDACQSSTAGAALTNAAALNGKIALIRRGTCSFVLKVKAAQNAGAIGVIMMNNVDGTPVAMGGTDATITIPSVMISKTDGDILEAAVLGGTVSGSLTTGPGTFTGNLVPGQQHINDIKVRNNGGVSEIYVAAGDTFYSAANSATYLGGPNFGLFKSVDGGATWTEVLLPLTANGYKHCPNDIEIGADNTIWVSTTRSLVYGDGGGKIFSSTDGVNFIDKYTVPGGRRTQIAVSTTNANKIYVLCEDTSSGEPNLFLTTNAFSTAPTTLGEPASDGDITATDFCRGQAFYDLVIAVDPTNDAIVYIGGINLHRSTDSGTSWIAISGWTTATPSNVHSDQHAIVFRPGNSNQAVFGNDGGVYYASTLSSASVSSTAISSRNNGLNITQFYSVGVAPTQAVSGLTLAGDYFAAGAQDNGTQYFANAAPVIGGSVRSQGGDGAFTLFDQGSDKYYISNYVYNENINIRPLPGSTVTARTLDNDNNGNNGAFIAPMVLDSNQDILYSDYSNGTTYQIRRYRNIKSGIVNRVSISNVLLTAPPTAFAVSPYTTTSTTLLVGTRLGKLFRIPTANTYIGTTTTTGTWVDITGPSFVGSISDIEYGSSENEIFVTMHNYNVVSVWYTSNGGTTWVNKEGNLPDMPVKAILKNPKNAEEVIIATELGVWYTNNFSAVSPTWNQSYNGMSNVKVMDLDLQVNTGYPNSYPAASYTVYAATYGRGIFSGSFTAPTLSSDDVAVSKGIKIYPNPSKGILNIAIPNYTGALNIEIFDINGRKVLTNKGDFASEKMMNLAGLQSGIYIVKLAGDNLTYSEKVMIK
ncbi:T9SS type A sorting domain-containing protein [Flavobacterium sp. LMO8]|uniref:WD40/YVTN/BNR-like repeat-containing protein n=1 Tax=Flavobacterium sp. LMO8 TaxID=2654244 RepID=UPI001290FEF2|nr:PA domain-containing protein [Flavobacterium sp. LMO8]MQP24502.1 T9SS type A sorting domain-containing protein [Flavobacterium sp. LMO8]